MCLKLFCPENVVVDYTFALRTYGMPVNYNIVLFWNLLFKISDSDHFYHVSPESIYFFLFNLFLIQS